MPEIPKAPFTAVIEDLLDPRKPFPPVHLRRFSDIPGSDLRALTRIWPQVAVERRRSILTDLEDLEDDDTLVDFHDFAVYAMQDDDPQVRQRAIRLLWNDPDTGLIRTLSKVMNEDEDHLVRAAAATGLGNFVFLGEIEEISKEKLHDVEEILLASMAGKDHAEVRRKALESLGFSSRPEVVELIQEAYKQGSLGWLVSALFAMGRSADQRWNKQVIESIDHPSAEVRMEAVRAAGELEIKSTLNDLLTAAYKDEDEGVRYAAIWSLSQLGGTRAGAMLQSLLDNARDDEEVQILEDALDNLAFNDDMSKFMMLELDEEPVEDPDELADDLEDE